MELSLVLARIIGPLFLLIGVAGVLNTRHYAAMAAEFFDSAPLFYLSGAMAFIAGIAIVLHHNIWVADWRVVITLIGWIGVVRGAVRLLFPKLGSVAAGILADATTMLRVGAAIVAILGLWLSYEGFRN